METKDINFLNEIIIIFEIIKLSVIQKHYSFKNIDYKFLFQIFVGNILFSIFDFSSMTNKNYWNKGIFKIQLFII